MRTLSAVALSLTLVAAAGADELVVAGKKQSGKLVAVADGVISFAVTGAEEPLRVAVKDVTAVEFGPISPRAGKYDEIELVDGSIVRCESFLIKKKVVEPVLTESAGGAVPKVELPLDVVFGVLRSANEPKNREDWKKLLASRGKRDLFVMRGEEGFTPVAGTVLEGNEAGDSVRFERESDGQTVTYKLTRAGGGLVFNPPPRGAIPPTLCKAFDRFGCSLNVRAVTVTGSSVQVRTVAGAVFDYPAGGLAKLDFGQANVAYLSDLDPRVDAPATVPGEPGFTFVRDRTSENAPLRLDGQTYTKGLWLAPDVTLTFPLNGDYREFRTVVGIDDSVGVANSAVRLVIEADGKAVFAETVSRKDKPRELTLDVKGAKTVTVRAEPQGLYLGNQVTLADARVQK